MDPSMTAIQHSPVLPRKYEDTKPALNQAFAHVSILGIGKKIEERTDEESEARLKDALEKCKKDVWKKAEIYKDECVYEAIKEIRNKEEENLAQMQKINENYLQNEILRIEETLQRRLVEQTDEERNAGKKRLQEIIEKLQKHFAIEKIAEIHATREEEQAIAFLNNNKQESLYKEELEEQRQQDAEHTLFELEELRNLLCRNRSRVVEETREVQKELANRHVAHVEADFNHIVLDLKQKLKDQEEKQRVTEEELANTEAAKNNLVLKLKMMQQSYVEFMESCRPDFSSGQADYLMPPNFLQPAINEQAE